MILHHYELSPFSEKIRLMFGYCGAQWESVISPAMPPRPIVDPLAGGYRRIPILQIGAEIFCDTKLIAAELARNFDKPELSFDTCGDEIAEYSNYIDTSIFMAGVQSATPSKMLLTVFKLFSPLQALKFIKDRAGIQKTSSVKPLSRQRALALIQKHYADMETRLQTNNYLFGTSPSIADFSAYHNIWFAHLTSGTKEVAGFSSINAWFLRMSELGHGKRIESTKETAFKAAEQSQTRDIPEDMKASDRINTHVEIKPIDYAKDAVSGVLIGENDSRWIIARETPSFGTLHVHFPKQGFGMVEQ